MEVVLTCKLKIDYPLEEAKRFVSTYTAACNYLSVAAFSLKNPANKKALNDLCYQEVRTKFGLKSQVAQSAIRGVAARYATLKSLKKPAKAPIVFGREPVQLQQGKDFSFSGDQLSVTTREGRVLVRYKAPPRLLECRKDWKLGGRLEQQLRGRETRFRRDTDHVISKRFVEFAEREGCTAIALENLTGIRDRCEGGKDFRRELHNWSQLRLRVFILYKASLRGIRFFPVDPAYTSQGCSRCGYVAKENRQGLRFQCKACGYRLHADLNAARNIRQRAIFFWQDQEKLGAPSVRPEVPGSSGTSLAL